MEYCLQTHYTPPPQKQEGARSINLWTALSTSCTLPSGMWYEIVTRQESSLRSGSFTSAIFHFPLTALLSCTRTTSPLWSFLLSVCHFGCMTRFGNTSLDQRFQKADMIAWMKSCRCFLLPRSWKGPSGMCAESRPSSRSLGQR